MRKKFAKETKAKTRNYCFALFAQQFRCFYCANFAFTAFTFLLLQRDKCGWEGLSVKSFFLFSISPRHLNAEKLSWEWYTEKMQNNAEIRMKDGGAMRRGCKKRWRTAQQRKNLWSIKVANDVKGALCFPLRPHPAFSWEEFSILSSSLCLKCTLSVARSGEGKERRERTPFYE